MRDSTVLKRALCLALSLWSCAAWAQSTPKLLLVGDSWAAQQWSDQSHALVFAEHGAEQHGVVGATTTVSGSTAAEWASPERLAMITQALVDNPSIDTVQLTIGGNDFLNAWSVSMTPEESAVLREQIRSDLGAVTAHVLARRPDMEVIVSLYDYPNFRDTLNSIVGFGLCRPLHQEMGQPTPLALNQAMIAFEGELAELAAHPRVHHVGHAGQMQYTFGLPGDGIPPGQLLPPGDPALPSPVAAMRDYGALGRDCFHLSADGYDVLVQNLYEHYFHVRFDSLFRSSLE